MYGSPSRSIVRYALGTTLLIFCLGPASAMCGEARRLMNLGGTWQIAEGAINEVPRDFPHTVPVPGLVDMAQPPFEDVGARGEGRTLRKDPRRQAYWYRRTFNIDGDVPAVALLKIHKARFGARVYLSGQSVGDYLPSFTPGYFDLQPHLQGNGQANELIICVASSALELPPTFQTGVDPEKIKYMAGIYDRVELILTDTPHVVNVQTVPDVAREAVRIVAEVANAGDAPVETGLKLTIRPAGSESDAATAETPAKIIAPGETVRFDTTVCIPDCRLWSPEDPFLYELVVDTGPDTYTTRFGMRSFTTDPDSGRVLLNGKPYFLRGSNVCIFRFYEDALRNGKPWDETWVRKLHRQFKQMHWNSLRYCIGFPPELWYEIADEEGLLIQDEFPIWYGGSRFPETVKPADLAAEFTDWLRDRWNHPSVVIWDAQNETIDDAVIAPAIGLVRGLDLSNRPWDNGWAAPQSPTDVTEYHPYRTGYARRSNRPFSLALFAKESGVPNNGPRQGMHPPYIINEYGWLWLNRDGTPTTLTQQIYENTLGADATADRRRHYYARTLAAMTEFWRAKRQCAGVLHFCGLAYSRPDGQTCDNFRDLDSLEYEPYFLQYVRDAFAPVGLMMDLWDDELPAGAEREIPVIVINDLYENQEISVRLRLTNGDKTIAETSRRCTIDPLGQHTERFPITVPNESGAYQLVAELHREGAEPVRSLRDFEVLTEQQRKQRLGISVGRPVTASSSVTVDNVTYPAEDAVDGDLSTRWSSEFADPQWIAVDLGREESISRVRLIWEGAYGKSYTIEVSPDGTTWQEVHAVEHGDGHTDEIKFAPTAARYVRMSGTQRGTRFGYSLWEFQVFP